MAPLPSLFKEFLEDIRPSSANIEDYIEGHKTLREKLQESDTLDDIHVADFLQGSYARSTALRPVEGKKSDVDVVFVTSLDKKDYPDPEGALEECVPFLEENYPDDKWDMNNRSFEIERENVDLDLVLTAAPSEATKDEITANDSVGDLSVEEALNGEQYNDALWNMDYKTGRESEDWKIDPLDIPNRYEDCWDKTHPLYVAAWTTEKNQETDEHYVNVVKAIKWWRRTQIDKPERPKGYPLEHIVGSCCPNDIGSVAEGITRTLEIFETRYRQDALQQVTPFMPDRALSSQDVLERIEGEDFAEFYYHAVEAGETAREALDANDPNVAREKWASILGDDFPEYGSGSDGDDSGGDGGHNGDDSSWSGRGDRDSQIHDERLA